MPQRAPTLLLCAATVLLSLASVSVSARDAHRLNCESGPLPMASAGGAWTPTGHHEHDDDDRALNVVGLTADQRLVCFNEKRAERPRQIGFISGLVTDTALVGIDFRVQDGKLYGVGNAGGVYTLDVHTASATWVNRLSVALSGTAFGVDFNPAADRLRIISNHGQNLRHNVHPDGVTLMDGALNYTAGTPAADVTGAGYTNNDLDSNTATTLYNIDTALDQVVLQVPPNSGGLAATGKLGIDATGVAGMDIYSTVRRGSTVDVRALAAITTAEGHSALYRISLPTGRATKVSSFHPQFPVMDIAIPLHQR